MYHVNLLQSLCSGLSHLISITPCQLQPWDTEKSEFMEPLHVLSKCQTTHEKKYKNMTYCVQNGLKLHQQSCSHWLIIKRKISSELLTVQVQTNMDLFPENAWAIYSYSSWLTLLWLFLRGDGHFKVKPPRVHVDIVSFVFWAVDGWGHSTHTSRSYWILFWSAARIHKSHGNYCLVSLGSICI